MPDHPLITCQQALAEARTLGLDRLDSQWLLLHALGRPASDRAWLLAHDTDLLSPAQLALWQQLSQRRAAGEPLAYIVGEQEFFGLLLQVDSRVLVPRADTETLVDWALLCLAGLPANARVLDLGTGSGAIALALKKSRPTLEVTAVDRSAEALTVARGNARQLGLPVQFFQSDWFDKVSGHFHLIASNPPYIASADPHLDALAHEPLQALTAGPDGLDDLRQIIARAPHHLVPHGWLLLEHGHDQAAAVGALLSGGGFVRVQSRPDLAGIARCSGAQWPGPGPEAADLAQSAG